MPNICFAPIHIHNPEAQVAVSTQLDMLERWGVTVMNTEIRDPAMLKYSDGMIGDFSYGDPKVELEVLKAREIGKPVLAMVSALSGLTIPESVRETVGPGLLLPAHGYSNKAVGRSFIKTFLGAHVGYNGPVDNLSLQTTQQM